MKKVVKFFLMSAVSVVGLFCAVPNAMCKETKPATSYYTVKTEKDLKDAVNLSNKGDTIVITGDIKLNSTLAIPSGKDLTIANDGRIRTIKRGNTYTNMIQISQGATLNLKGINGTDAKPTLLIDGDGNNKNSKFDGRIVTNCGTFNMYTGVSLQNNRIEQAEDSLRGGVVGCTPNSRFNMYGGAINQNRLRNTYAYRGNCYGIIYLWSGSTFNMSGGIISNNTSATCAPAENYGIIYCEGKSILNINGGEISKNNGGIYCERDTIANMANGSITGNSYGIKSSGEFKMSGGSISENSGTGVTSTGTFEMSGGNISKNSGTGVTSSVTFKMSGGNISENSGTGVISSGKFTMSGGSIDNNKKGLEINGEFVLSKNSQIVGNPICLAKGKKIIIDGFISGNSGSFMCISLQEYKLLNTQKVVAVINRANLDDAVGKFRLSDKRYGINYEGYVDTIQCQGFEKTDADTGIRISSCESVLSKDVEVSITKVESIDNIKDATFYIESLCDSVKNLYSVKFTSNGKPYVPQETDKITFYVPIKEFDTGKIPEVKLYDSNKKTISEGGEVKAVKGMLYIKIPTTEGNLQ